jgi:hypothetical protein
MAACATKNPLPADRERSPAFSGRSRPQEYGPPIAHTGERDERLRALFDQFRHGFEQTDTARSRVVSTGRTRTAANESYQKKSLTSIYFVCFLFAFCFGKSLRTRPFGSDVDDDGPQAPIGSKWARLRSGRSGFGQPQDAYAPSCEQTDRGTSFATTRPSTRTA